MHLEKDFADVPIDRALLMRLHIEPLKKICVKFITFPESLDDEHGGKEYELFFTKVVDFKLDMTIDHSRKVISHKVFSESEYLTAFKTRPIRYAARIDRGKLHHFQLVCEGGQMDLIAQHFSSVLIQET